MFQGHEDGCRLIGPILFRDGMICQRLSSKQNLSSIKFKYIADMFANLFVIPGENGSDSQVLKVSLLCLLLDNVQEFSFPPVPVHEKNRLS